MYFSPLRAKLCSLAAPRAGRSEKPSRTPIRDHGFNEKCKMLRFLHFSRKTCVANQGYAKAFFSGPTLRSGPLRPPKTQKTGFLGVAKTPKIAILEVLGLLLTKVPKNCVFWYKISNSARFFCEKTCAEFEKALLRTFCAKSL